MTGWAIFAGAGALVMAGLWVVARLRGGEALLALAALSAAAAGYAWQGRPGLAGAAAQDRTATGLAPDTLYMGERQKLMNVYGEAGQYLTFADGLNRAGQDRAAVSALGGAVAKYPKDVNLRIAYAHALFVLADSNVTPAVALAFERAAAVGGMDPAARYFAGLTDLEAGDLAGAERRWRALLSVTPPGSPWYAVLGDRLRVLAALNERLAAGR